MVDGASGAERLAVYELSPAGASGAGSGRDRRRDVPMTTRPVPKRHWRSYGNAMGPLFSEGWDRARHHHQQLDRGMTIARE
jgi:hypothetical protein